MGAFCAHGHRYVPAQVVVEATGENPATVYASVEVIGRGAVSFWAAGDRKYSTNNSISYWPICAALDE